MKPIHSTHTPPSAVLYPSPAMPCRMFFFFLFSLPFSHLQQKTRQHIRKKLTTERRDNEQLK
jgi:hypothetical protein